MDTLTHGLAGALIGRALPSSGDADLDARLERREAWTGFLSAMLPDADALPNPLSAEFYIEHHRGLTHSFVLLPVWAIVIGLLASWRLLAASGEEGAAARRTGRLRLVAVAGLGVVSHILLDWVTSWGTRFLAPLSEAAFALDWLFILDGVLSGVLLAGLAAAFVIFRRQARFAARASLVAASCYVAFCGIQHERAVGLAARLAPSAAAHAAVPQPFSPFRWLLLSDADAGVRLDFVDFLRHGPAPVPPKDALARFHGSPATLDRLVPALASFYRAPEDPAPFVLPKRDGPLAGEALAEASTGVFGRFARFPVGREKDGTDGSAVVILRDARFAHLSDRLDPFVYEILFGPDGRPRAAGFPSPRWTRPPGTDRIGVAR
ncbi:MAG TPA: metal-dependent hydrolase [Thermoanaerobaculia bacterium]|nr:metal-dependent hydrolase [Thermoanaerobaculia bacterium]